MGNNSKLFPLLINTDQRLNTVFTESDDKTSIIKLLNPTKADKFENISTRMIQLCGDSVTLSLAQIFKFSVSQDVFPNTWKMANIILVHEKKAKYLVKNYRPISLCQYLL